MLRATKPFARSAECLRNVNCRAASVSSIMSPDMNHSKRVRFQNHVLRFVRAHAPSVLPLVCACPTVAICCGRDVEPEEEVRVWLALGVRGMGVPGEEVILSLYGFPCPQSRQASERMVTGRELEAVGS
jgi:hypothetical protein